MVPLPLNLPTDASVQMVRTFENSATRWPDYQDGIPPRSLVVVLTRQGGGEISVQMIAASLL